MVHKKIQIDKYQLIEAAWHVSVMCVWGAGGVQCTLYSLVNGPSTQHCRLCHHKSPPLCHTLKDVHIHMVEQFPGTSVVAMLVLLLLISLHRFV